MRSYKYTSYRERLFIDLLFRFTPPSKLNDPFEGQPNKQDVIDRASKAVWKDEEAKKDLLNTIINKDIYNDDIGIFCLSESKHSLIMWSHYADNHRGIIIEFNTLHPFFHQSINTTKKYTISSELFGKLFKVKYDRVRLTFFEALDGTIENFHLLNKSDDWIYEKEYRMFMPRDHRDGYGTNKDGHTDNNIDLFRIPGDAISKVILGARSEKARIIQDITEAKKQNPQLANLIIEEGIVHLSLYHIECKKVNL